VRRSFASVVPSAASASARDTRLHGSRSAGRAAARAVAAAMPSAASTSSGFSMRFSASSAILAACSSVAFDPATSTVTAWSPCVGRDHGLALRRDATRLVLPRLVTRTWKELKCPAHAGRRDAEAPTMLCTVSQSLSYGLFMLFPGDVKWFEKSFTLLGGLRNAVRKFSPGAPRRHRPLRHPSRCAEFPARYLPSFARSPHEPRS